MDRYLIAAIGLQKQLVILRALREQMRNESGSQSTRNLTILIERIEDTYARVAADFKPPTLH